MSRGSLAEVGRRERLMTSVQHRPTPEVGVHHVPSWVWIALGAVLAVAIGMAIGYLIADTDTTTTAAAVPVEGFEYDHEVTTGKVAAPGVTTAYMGNSGVLFPDPPIVAPVMGFEPMIEATSMHMLEGLVTSEYYGYSGELYPAATVAPMAMGFDYDHEVTPIHVIDADDWAKASFVGQSGALSIEH